MFGPRNFDENPERILKTNVAKKILALSDKQIIELCNICTHDESGRHFTQFSDNWQLFEELKLVKIDRPIHNKTGIPYSVEHWEIYVTMRGEIVINMNDKMLEQHFGYNVTCPIG